jgi:quercetin dioxygenase-like cupin family protein
MEEAMRAELEERLRSEGLSATSWGNDPGDRYGEHSHDYDKVLVATAGSITFHLPELGREVELHAGERLDLPARTRHSATVGPEGVTCLEAHLPAGSHDGEARHHPAGW